MKVVLRANNGRLNSLSHLFCNTKSNVENIKGVAIIKEDFALFKKGEELVVVENKRHSVAESLLKDFNIAPDKHLGLQMIPLDIDYSDHNSINLNKGINLKAVEIVPFDEYKEHYNKQLKEKKKETMTKFKIRKEYENKTNLLGKEEIDKLYKSLNLPEDKDIDKADYLEFYMYFGNNLKYYKAFRQVKEDGNVSWRDIKKLKYGDIDFRKGTIQFQCENKANA